MHRRIDAVLFLTVALIAVPTLTVIVRLATLGHVYLGLDLALMDIHVRNALHFHETLGPFDRFGWSHPGPTYFYVLSVVHRFIGDGGRTQFIGAALINLTAALGVVWLVLRHVGKWPALWASACVALLALSQTSVANSSSEASVSPIGVFLSPWNPYVVLLPLVLFGVLCAVSSRGSWTSLVGAALVGTFTVQTDIATAPIVVVFLVVSVLLAAIHTHRDATRSTPWGLIAAGTGVTLLLWIPPIIQQVTSTPGNLTRIWRFFTTHGSGRSLGSGLKLALTADQYLLGYPHQISLLPSVSSFHATLTLAIALLAGLGAVVLGIRLRVPLSTALGVGSLLGLAVGAVAVAHIYGFVYPYDVQWEIALPLLAVIGLGVAVFHSNPKKFATTTLCVAASGLAVLFTVQMIRLPVARASDADVAAAWQIVAPHLPHGHQYVYVNYLGPASEGDMLFGVMNELASRGFRPRVNEFWIREVGIQYVTHHAEPISIVMYHRSPAAQATPGYIGHTRDVDIVLTRSAA